MVRGDVDAATYFHDSAMSLFARMKLEELAVLKYADAGVNFHGNAILASSKPDCAQPPGRRTSDAAAAQRAHPQDMTRVSTLPDETALDERDGRYLRKAIAWSHAGRRRGNQPFGAIIVSAQGEVLAEAYCSTTETGDCTAHAETNAVRKLAERKLPRESLAGATIYSSGEPCVMCAGAIFWADIGRVVFGIDAERLRVFRGEHGDQRDAELSCRDVFRASPHPIECIGPALIDEAGAAHVGAWKT